MSNIKEICDKCGKEYSKGVGVVSIGTKSYHFDCAPKIVYETEFDGRIAEILKSYIKKSDVLGMIEEVKEIADRIKLEFDVNICDCGEEWKETDCAEYTGNLVTALSDLSNKIRG